MDKQFTALRLQRVRAGYPQNTLAKKIGRSQPWLSRAERGLPGSIITAKDAALIAATLGLPIEAVFSHEEGAK